MKKFKIYLTIATLLVGFLAGCTKNFEEINSNPNSPTTLESGLLLAGIISSAQNNSYSTFVGGDMGSCWSQQWSKVEYTDEERYIPRTSIIEMIWKKQLSLAFPNPNDYSAFMGGYSQSTGVFTIILILLINRIIKKFKI